MAEEKEEKKEEKEGVEDLEIEVNEEIAATPHFGK